MLGDNRGAVHPFSDNLHECKQAFGSVSNVGRMKRREKLAAKLWLSVVKLVQFAATFNENELGTAVIVTDHE